jgi:catechol 2,3-dioxygenase-like lactoylglutathione lyase family enzyme
MIMIGKVVASHTGVTVSDIDKAIHFWRDIMGFEVTPKMRRSGPFFERLTGVQGADIDIAYVTMPGHTIELLGYARPAEKIRNTLRPCDPGSLHFCLTVEDMDGTLEKLREGGFIAINPAQTVAEGPRKGARAVYTRSVDGVIIELIQEPK